VNSFSLPSSRSIDEQIGLTDKRAAIRKPWWLAALALVVAGGALAACATRRPYGAVSLRNGTVQARPRHIEFAALAGPYAPQDAPPSVVVNALRDSSQPEFTAADVRAARRVTPNDTVWLVPSEGGNLCLVALVAPLVPLVNGTTLPPTPSWDCTPISSARAGRLVVTQSLATTPVVSPLTKVLGVVPDGVSLVEVISTRGRVRRVGVLRNTYEVAMRDPAIARFVTRDSRRVTTHTISLVTFRGSPANGHSAIP
jgi:hypothetical protein